MSAVIGLFTHRFLEPTHVAIAQAIRGLCAYRFKVFSKRFLSLDRFRFENVEALVHWVKYDPADRDPGVDLYHSIYDGKTSFRVLPLREAYPAPYVVTFHGGKDIATGIDDPRYADRVAELFRFADAFTVVCESHRRKVISRGAPPERVHVIPVGIVPELYLPATSAPVDPPLICQAARFVEKKGLLDSVRVFARVRARCPSAQLVLAGDGPLRAVVEAEVRRLGLDSACRFAGLLSHRETIELLRSAHVYLHPARTGADGNQEGTPAIVIEAQAVGLPVVATRSGAIPDIVEHGRTGLLAEEGNIDEITGAVLAVLDDFEAGRRIGGTAREVALNRHALSHVVASYDRLYQNLLHRN
jgi:glycosyltransferase involved in cell wall biosynthesis